VAGMEAFAVKGSSGLTDCFSSAAAARRAYRLHKALLAIFRVPQFLKLRSSSHFMVRQRS
jgi:hypothetical protein